MAYKAWRLVAWASAFVFLVPLIPVRYRKCRLAVAVLSSLLQAFVPCMHGYLMKHYWYKKTVSSSSGLIMELALYISAALVTFPIMQYNILRWRFSIHCRPNCRREGIGDDDFPCHTMTNSSASYRPSRRTCLLAQGTKDWLNRIRGQAAAALFEGLASAECASPTRGDGGRSSRKDRFLDSACDQCQPLVTDQDSIEKGSEEGELKLVDLPVFVDRDKSQGRSFRGTASVGNPVSLNDVSSAGHRAKPRPLGTPELEPGRTSSSQIANFRQGTQIVVCLMLGYALVLAYVLFDVACERVFDESNIRLFTRVFRLSAIELILYWAYVMLVFWGMFASITTCTVFHKLCSEQREATKLTVVVLQRSKDRETACRRIDELVEFLRLRQDTMKLWFVLHTLAFTFILVLQFWFFIHNPVFVTRPVSSWTNLPHHVQVRAIACMFPFGRFAMHD